MTQGIGKGSYGETVSVFMDYIYFYLYLFYVVKTIFYSCTEFGHNIWSSGIRTQTRVYQKIIFSPPTRGGKKRCWPGAK